MNVPGDAHLPRERDVIPQHGAPGDPDLRCQQRVGADADTVRNLHQVVDLRPRLDARLSD